MSTKTRRVTKTQANKALAYVKRHFKQRGYDETDMRELTLVMDWDWPRGGPTTAIIWEGGPYDWAINLDFTIAVGAAAGVFAEPYSGWALCLYRDD